MIPQKHEGGALIDGLPGERQAFTIAANGKAFRVLIDGLYSNKIQAVTRELWSNAADSHIEAGIPNTPFHVSVPTNLDPTFRVRDYGVGISHEDVMHLYTTVFESSKEGTNEQTGMLGLGSKSPFAYTDTFSVVSFYHGVRRVYVANIATDGIPSMTHISTNQTDDPQGIEVSFPVNRADITTFHREAQWISMGFKVKPIIDGMTLKHAKPRMSGTNWAIYADGTFGELRTRNLIRQGVACYPNESIPVPGLGASWVTIIDVPIGTADVTASRESLSYTPETKIKIKEIVERVSEEIIADVKAEIAKAKTRIELARVYSEFNGMLPNLRGSVEVSLLASPASGGGNRIYESTSRCPGDVVAVGSEYGKTGVRMSHRRFKSSIEVSLLDSGRVRLFVDYGEPLVRKRKRVQKYCQQNPNTDFVVTAEYNDKGKEVAAAWVTECWEIPDDRVFSLNMIPDPGPTSRPSSGPKAKKLLAMGQFWMIRKAGVCETEFGMGLGPRTGFTNGWPHAMVDAVKYLSDGLVKQPTHDILYVTELQATRLGLPHDRRYDVVVRATLKSQVKSPALDEALAVIELGQHVSGHQADVVREQFFPHLKMRMSEANALITKARYGQIDLQVRTIGVNVRDQVRALVATYPLLFGNTDKGVFEKYIRQVQAAEAKEVQPA